MIGVTRPGRAAQWKRLMSSVLGLSPHRFPLGPPCRVYAPAQFSKLCFRNIHMKRANSGLITARLLCAFSHSVRPPAKPVMGYGERSQHALLRVSGRVRDADLRVETAELRRALARERQRDRRYRSARLERTEPKRLFQYRAVPVLALASRFRKARMSRSSARCTAATAGGARRRRIQWSGPCPGRQKIMASRARVIAR
jgi:hypothetical protein